MFLNYSILIHFVFFCFFFRPIKNIKVLVLILKIVFELDIIAVFIIPDPTEFEKGLDTKVYVTAVTSIFLSFFLFLGCIMLCRYFDMLCWSEAAPQDHHRAGTELEQVSPTAPPPESPDKDLPPAYETLFPGR